MKRKLNKKPNPDYFRSGHHHNCMYCDQPIARLVDGQLRPLGNKAHVLLEKKSKGLYVINCCADCADELDWSDQDTLTQTHNAVITGWELTEKRNGLSNNELKRRKSLRDKDKPVRGFSRVESNPTERTAIVAAYMKHLQKAKQPKNDKGRAR